MRAVVTGRLAVHWCEHNGERAVSQRDLGVELGTRGYRRGRSKRRRYRTGIGLRPDGAPHAVTQGDA